MRPMIKIGAVLVSVSSLFALTPSNAQIDNVTIQGQYGSTIQLSAGTPGGTGGRTASVTNSSTGALSVGAPTDSEGFASSIDFGDLARGDGNPVMGTVGLRLRSNTSFLMTASLVNFTSSALRYQGRDIGPADYGSFVKVWIGQMSSTGQNSANAGTVSLNNRFTSGMKLSEMARGPATANATVMATGPAASQGGSFQSQNNAIELPVYVSIPTGYELGPAPGAASGSFSFTMQFAAHGGP